MSQVGSLGEEAIKLFGVVEEWLRAAASGSSSPTESSSAEAGGATGGSPFDAFSEQVGERHAGPECLICPICQLLALVRSSRPEAFEHVVDAVGSLMLALRSVIEEHERTWSKRRRPSAVQHITIS